MRNRVLALLLSAIVLQVTGEAADSVDTERIGHDGKQGALSITLTPDSPTLGLEDVRRGQVGFNVTIRNEAQTPVVIAHPTACVPAGFGTGKSATREEWHGKSEILLAIARPDGEPVVLREGMFALFDPGNVDRLVIEPGGTETFHVGWFFPNARGRWEQDEVSWEVFRQPGEYKVSLVYRNHFPRAWTRDPASGEVSMIDVWQGELESNVVTFTVISD